jgi:hypothetical protein
LTLILQFGIPLAFFRDTLPPKKLLGSKDPGFIMKRRRELESYLQNVFHFLSQDLPPVLADFLDFPTARPSSIFTKEKTIIAYIDQWMEQCSGPVTF